MKAADVANAVSACLVTKQYRVQCKMNAINIALWVSFMCVCVCGGGGGGLALLRYLYTHFCGPRGMPSDRTSPLCG